MSNQSSRGKEWNRVREMVLRRDYYQCAYCHNAADTVDHITPKALGGGDEPSNLVAACRACNGRKGARIRERRTYLNPTYFPNGMAL